jgi:hypothetical protein
MTADFSAYPQKWGLRQPDADIDHRRVLNLMTYFRRRGYARADLRWRRVLGDCNEWR